jgi:hypothetical protein
MEEILRELELRASWKEAMRKCCRSNKLNVDLVSYFTPLRFRATYAKFKAMYAPPKSATRSAARTRPSGGWRTSSKLSTG